MKAPPAATLRGSRLDEFARHLTPGILDFASGVPVVAAPRAFRREAARAVSTRRQGYADSAGLPALRAAIAADLARGGFEVDADAGVAITMVATGGLQAAFAAAVKSGDEVLVPVPGYEPVFDMIRLAGATPVPVSLEPRTWRLCPAALRAALSGRTRAIYLNQPSNPTGRIFTSAEIQAIIAVCAEYDLAVVEDAVYSSFFYKDPPAVLGADAPLSGRVIRVGSFSKSYAIPGWRLGYAAALGALGEHVRRAAETMSGGAVAPLQAAVLAAGLDAVDGPALRSAYRQRRDRLAAILSRAGFRAALPDGGTYIWAEYASGYSARRLLQQGVAAMPGTFLYTDEEGGATYARFCFARPMSMIDALQSVMLRQDLDEARMCAAPIERIHA